MSKTLFYAIIGGVVAVEVLFFFFLVLPNMSAASGLVEEVETELKKLSRFAKMKPEAFPTKDAAERHKENAKAIKDGYIACLRYFEELDRQKLESYFVGLGKEPNPQDFAAKYKDSMDALKKRCESKGIEVAHRDARLTEQQRRLLNEVERTREESSTIPIPRDEFGFWNVENITAENMRAAQKQYWVQEAFVDALVEAKAKRLLVIAFKYPEKKKRETSRRRRRGEVEKKTELERLFKTFDVTLVAELPYKNLNRFVNSIMDVARYKLLFSLLNLRVVKKELESAVVPDPSALWELKSAADAGNAEAAEKLSLLKGKSIELDREDLNGVFPIVIEKDGNALSLGEVTMDRLRDGRLPITQDDLLSEPPVLVMLKLRLYDFSPDEGARKLLESSR